MVWRLRLRRDFLLWCTFLARLRRLPPVLRRARRRLVRPSAPTFPARRRAAQTLFMAFERFRDPFAIACLLLGLRRFLRWRQPLSAARRRFLMAHGWALPARRRAGFLRCLLLRRRPAFISGYFRARLRNAARYHRSAAVGMLEAGLAYARLRSADRRPRRLRAGFLRPRLRRAWRLSHACCAAIGM